MSQKALMSQKAEELAQDETWIGRHTPGLKGGMMGKVLYSAQAHVTGGRADGHGATSDGALDVVLRPPAEMGGDGEGTNPEQLFAVGYAACFESALGGAARHAKQELGDVSIDSTVSLVVAGEGTYKLAVTLDVHLPSIASPETATELVRAAHKICPYSNATRGNIDVELIANGKVVDAAV
jgi:lipoyl-dependent peroxiredoxin